MRKIITFLLGLLGVVVMLEAHAQDSGFKAVAEELPRPIYDQRPEFVDLYYKAWELAYERIDTIAGLPAPVYMDEAHMSSRIWIWDTCLMAHFCKYCPSIFPGIESLDNFYGVMLADQTTPLPQVLGNIWCGKNYGKMVPFKIHHADNPPLFAWTEYVYALQTGDRARLEKVYVENKYLQRWYDLFESFDPAAPRPYGSSQKVALKKFDDGYAWNGCSSGMDNTPRGRSATGTSRENCPDNSDLRWVDALSFQGLSALYMSKIADLLGLSDEAKVWKEHHQKMTEKLNGYYWDDADSFYYDIFSDGSKCKVKTIASWWPLLAEMAPLERQDKMIAHLRNPNEFGGFVATPSLSRSDADFIADGGYWRGSVWLPTTYMALKTVDLAGEYDLAREIAAQLLNHMWRTYEDYEPHTIWECYSPTEYLPARNKKAEIVRNDFCGWSALGPISIFLEDLIGIKEANAFTNTLVCNFEKKPQGRVGVENYRFGNIVCSIVSTKSHVRVTSNLPFTLILDGREHKVKAGRNTYRR